MDFLPTFGEALAAADRLLIMHSADLSQSTKDALISAATKVSPVDKLVEVGEVLYAARADLSDDSLVIAGQVIEFCTRNGWHGLTNDARGERMVAAIRRQLGEPHPTGGEWPDPETDPAPKGARAQQAALPEPST